jgi:hypothetical protein
MAKADSTQPGEEEKPVDRSRQQSRERNRRYREKHGSRIRQKARENYHKRKAAGVLPDREKTRRWGRGTGKRYRERHHEKILQRAREWKAQNPERVRGYYRKHMRNKRLRDRCFALKQDVAVRIGYALSSQGARKAARTLALVGCTVRELAAHLESLFLPGMTWDNRSVNGWHIDHIIPVSKFDLNDPQQQAAAFHYTNLQPLWASENRRKSNKVQGQNLFGFAYAARIADAAAAKPKRRRKHGGRHKPD